MMQLQSSQLVTHEWYHYDLQPCISPLEHAKQGGHTAPHDGCRLDVMLVVQQEVGLHLLDQGAGVAMKVVVALRQQLVPGPRHLQGSTQAQYSRVLQAF